MNHGEANSFPSLVVGTYKEVDECFATIASPGPVLHFGAVYVPHSVLPTTYHNTARSSYKCQTGTLQVYAVGEEEAQRRKKKIHRTIQMLSRPGSSGGSGCFELVSINTASSRTSWKGVYKYR